MKEFEFEYKGFRYTLFVKDCITLVIEKENIYKGESEKGAYYVIDNNEWRYRVMSNHVKASGAATGLIEYIARNINQGFCVSVTAGLLDNILDKVKPVKAVL